MSEIRRRTWVLVLLALLALFAGCKGESSPTAPPVTNPPTGTTGTTTTTPVTGATIVLTVSKTNPVVGSSSVITATVTVNGTPAPNGTAVEFSTNNGSFCLVTDGCVATTPPIQAALRTTTNGVSTIVLTSSSATTATVQAVVNNALAKTTVVFSATPTEPTPPNTTPTITSVTPATGRPAGGDTVTINGSNFVGPVRVLFEAPGGVTKEAQVISASATQIKVLSPGFDVGTGQQTVANVVVINNAGGPAETRVTSAAATFTYQAAVLTPKITTASPASGPINGGTRVTLFGEGFQYPVQVFFGAQEAQVVSVVFNQIVVLSPPASTTSAGGSGAVTGTVDIKVINIASATNGVLPAVFRYTPKMQVILVGPTEGPFTGGTDVTIDGIGFDDPLSVVVAGVAAQVIRVSGSQILARTSGVIPQSCGDISGPVVVTNGENGDQASGPIFIYRVGKPFIVSVLAASGTLTPGGSALITILNANGLPVIKIGTTTVPITGTTVNANGTTTFTVTIPSSVTLATVACPSGGSRPTSTSLDVTFTSGETGCTVTSTGGITIEPPAVGNLFLTPNPLTLTAKAANPGSAGPPVVPPTPAQNGNGTFTIVNTGAAPLTITSVTSSSAQFLVTSNPTGTTLAPCDSTIAAVQYIAESSGQSSVGQIVVTATSGTSILTRTESVIGNTQ